jgi:hypothetical protein
VDRITGRAFRGKADAAELFADLPATLLERTLA